MATDRNSIVSILLAMACLLWPAAWNGYPIVFADTGTYLSQAIHLYLGWDRPIFYSLFLLTLHWTLTLWPVVMAQALLTALLLAAAIRQAGLSIWALAPLTLFLSLFTWLPWLVCQIMPDIFTPLLVLTMCLLANGAGTGTGTGTRTGSLLLVPAAAFMIAAQQSSLPLSLTLIAALLPLRRMRWSVLLLPPVLAVAALLAVNLAGHGRLSVSPFGNVFLLARIIYDGPGMIVLQRDCPAAQWRLCPYLDQFPPTSDEFLWRADSPILAAGGHKAIAADASAIIAAALRAEPWLALRAFAANAWEQLRRFDSGDGLEAWPDQVSPWLARDFPAWENQAYRAARQQNGALPVPPILATTHWIVAMAGIIACLALLPLALRRRHSVAAVLLAVLLVLPVSAAITGGLSTPHDRYQSRVMWLPPFVAIIAAAALLRPRR